MVKSFFVRMNLGVFILKSYEPMPSEDLETANFRHGLGVSSVVHIYQYLANPRPASKALNLFASEA